MRVIFFAPDEKPSFRTRVPLGTGGKTPRETLFPEAYTGGIRNYPAVRRTISRFNICTKITYKNDQRIAPRRPPTPAVGNRIDVGGLRNLFVPRGRVFIKRYFFFTRRQEFLAPPGVSLIPFASDRKI